MTVSGTRANYVFRNYERCDTCDTRIETVLCVHVGFVLHVHHLDHVQVGRLVSFLDGQHCVDHVLQQTTRSTHTCKQRSIKPAANEMQVSFLYTTCVCTCSMSMWNVFFCTNASFQANLGEQIGELLVHLRPQRRLRDVDQHLTIHLLFHFDLFKNLFFKAKVDMRRADTVKVRLLQIVSCSSTEYRPKKNAIFRLTHL